VIFASQELLQVVCGILFYEELKHEIFGLHDSTIRRKRGILSDRQLRIVPKRLYYTPVQTVGNKSRDDWDYVEIVKSGDASMLLKIHCKIEEY